MYYFSPKINGIEYVIYNKNDSIQRRLLAGQQWNEQIINIIKEYVTKKKLTHFLNVGCHIGSVCLPLSLYITKVTAVEAYPSTYTHLIENIRLNRIQNVHALNIALGNTEEDIYFMSEEKICPVEHTNRFINNTGGMHVFTEKDIQNNVRSSVLTDKKIKNKMNTLDAIEIDNFDILLVDIEGFEYEFLLGAKEKILKNKPIIIIEIWNNAKRLQENMSTTQEDIINFIESLQYTLIKNIGEDYIFEPVA
jgi:FkbM family methyltransferase